MSWDISLGKLYRKGTASVRKSALLLKISDIGKIFDVEDLEKLNYKRSEGC
jgi:hypothetical protein